MPAAVTPKLTYHGGALLTSVEVYTIFWGTGWQSTPQSDLIPKLNGFFDFILTSSLMDLLGEYSVPGKDIGHGKRTGTTTITSTDPGTLQPDGSRIVADADIQAAIQGWISNHDIPQPDANTLFFVYMPPNVRVDAFGTSSCTGFCGYHNAINGSIFYAVEPYISCSGCKSGSGGIFDSLTEVSSHELCEAITDPDPFTGWNDDNVDDGEIGDLCNFQATTIGGYNVQLEWSNRASACRISPATAWGQFDLTAATSAPPAAGDPDGYVFDAEGRQHIVYLGTDGHIHELGYTPGPGATWGHFDLSAATSAPPAAGNPNGYVFKAENRQHIVYLGTDGHIHELGYTPGPGATWGHFDLTAATSAPPAAGDPDGYVFDAEGRQHIVYLGTDGHIHELGYTPGPGAAWGHFDLTAATSAPPAAGNPHGYVFKAENRQHIVYLGTDGHIHELGYTPGPGAAWGHFDLSAATGAPPAAGNPDGYVFDAEGRQHIVYRGTDGHIHELGYTPGPGAAWGHFDLSAATSAPPAAGDPDGYVFKAENRQHVVYLGTDGHIHELGYTPGPGATWGHFDLTAATSAPPAAGDPDGYVFDAEGRQHIVYRGTDGHIHELGYTLGT